MPLASLQPSIECRALGKTLPSGGQMLTILDDIRLTILPGEVVAILGPSGSGKSTLLGLMAGLDRPSSGEVRIDGQRIDDLDEDALAILRRTKIGFVFQSFQLLGNLTALENVLMPLELIGARGARGRAHDLLERVGLAERTHHYPAQLSGGEQQRVALARAFAPRPPILFADEPTGNLDSATGERILELITELQAHERSTLVLVTHDREVARRAKRRIHLHAGRLARDESDAEPEATAR
jgi:putative ABC transport system ATP-binding protein